MKRLITSLLFIFTAKFAIAASVDDLRWIGQDYPPYIFIDEDGSRNGPLVDFVATIMKKIDSSETKDNIDIRTFSKMFFFSNNNENTIFFPLAKTEDRAKYFKWVGPIFVNEPVVYAKAQNRSTDKGLTGRKPILIKKIDDLKDYKILGREKYTGVVQLQNANIDVSIGNTDLDNIVALKNDETDLVVCDKSVGRYLLKTLGVDPHDYQIVYTLDTNEMSFAFNKDTDDELVNKVAEALKTTKIKLDN